MATSQQRVFFALWPDDAVRDQINQAVQPVIKNNPARQVPRHNWHITLAFIGNVSTENLSCMVEQADKVQLQPFELSLDRFDYWPKPRVIWLGCKTMPNKLTRLVGDLHQQLAACDYTAEYKSYTPHITLFRNAKQALSQHAISPIVWSVNKFVLVESVIGQQGSRYRIIKQW